MLTYHFALRKNWKWLTPLKVLNITIAVSLAHDQVSFCECEKVDHVMRFSYNRLFIQVCTIHGRRTQAEQISGRQKPLSCSDTCYSYAKSSLRCFACSHFSFQTSYEKLELWAFVRWVVSLPNSKTMKTK